MKNIPKKRLKELEEKFEYSFKNVSLLETGLTHTSFINESREGEDASGQDNERFEFLGDSVLSLVISELLMEHFPDKNEGALSRKRASIVSEKSLAKIARKISLGEYLLLGKGEDKTRGREKDSILANAVEAVIGAVYLDGGLPKAKSFISRYFKNIIRYSAKPGSYKDYKTLAQEIAQRLFKKTPVYKLVAVCGPDHNRTFESELHIGEEIYGRGKGRSKKDSEQKCARMALKKLEEAR